MNTRKTNPKWNNGHPQEWTLSHPDGRSFRFATKPNNPGEIAVFWTKVSSQEDRFMPHCLINKARRMWDTLIEEGCTQQ